MVLLETTLASITVLRASMIIFPIFKTSRLEAISAMKARASTDWSTMTSPTANQSSLTMLRAQIFAEITARLDQTSIEQFVMSVKTVVSLASKTMQFAKIKP